MIKVLEKKVSDKIAAGEVVERPVSIVKELVENSIDAKANSIVCEIKNGGKSFIRITDNGIGIEEKDVKTAFLRHATSKITNVDDLNKLITLGFRGEALASIAAVSRVELLTKTKDNNVGTKLIIHGGEIVSEANTGCPDGTTIVITDLFYNTPARQKFLKSDGAESGLIIDLISQFALAYENIKFKLINNGRTLFTTNGKGNRLNVISQIYPNIDIKNLVEINYSNEIFDLKGYTSTPVMSKNNKRSQIFFVNGRVVSSKVIEKGLQEGYKERLFEGRHPVTFLFLNTNPKLLDVNIHPNKRQVRFDNENETIAFISDAIKSTLGRKDAVVNAGNIFKFNEHRSNKHNINSTINKIDKNSDNFQEQIKKYNEEVLGINFNKKDKKNITNEKEQVSIKQLLSTKVETPLNKDDESYLKERELQIDPPLNKPFDFSDLNILCSIFKTYILATDEDSFYMFDQHACHERIFYEKLVSNYNKSNKQSQLILTPILITSSLTVGEKEYDWLSSLRNIGFSIENFGNNSYRITEIPTFMSLSEAEDFINDYLDNLDEKTNLSNTVIINKLITKSCKAAIKANDNINFDEMHALLEDLSTCINPFSCPHGRPTFVKMTKYEIEKLFKRIQ